MFSPGSMQYVSLDLMEKQYMHAVKTFFFTLYLLAANWRVSDCSLLVVQEVIGS
jgi:hypothetical protein